MRLSKEEIYNQVAQGIMSVEEALAELGSLAGTVPLPEDRSKIQIEREFSVSEGQNALWVIYQLNPDNYAYNVPMAYYIDNVDEKALEKAFQTLWDRHPSLRAVFFEANERVMQRSVANRKVDFQIKTVRVGKDSEWYPLIKEEARKPFNLETGPLMRVILFKNTTGKSVLLMNIHHIVFDGMSIQIFLRELKALYLGEINGVQPELTSPQATFAEYIEWLKKMLRSEEGQIHRKYWAKQLADEITPLELPLDFPRPVVPTYNGAHYLIETTPKMAKQIKDAALSLNTSTFAFMMTAFKVLLFRYAGQNDLLVGTPVLGRPQVKFEDVIGYFMNMMVIRSLARNDLTFQDYLGQVNDHILEGLEHSHYPLMSLAKELKKTKLFHVAFYFQNWVEEVAHNNISGSEFKLEPMFEIHQEGEFELTLEIMELSDKYLLCFKYNPDIFASSTIERMCGHYAQVLKEIVSNPQSKLADLQILTETEIRQITVDWNRTQKNYPRQKCVHQLFEEQVKGSPQSIAVIYEEKQLTYLELNKQSDLLARYLQANGAGRGKMIGIFMERSHEMLIGLLGILKAGCAYIPLDPIYPSERLQYMIEDTKPEFILTQSRIAGKLPPHQAKEVLIDQEWDRIGLQDSKVLRKHGFGNPNTGSGPQDVAYVIFTSGSTGRPKGVQVLHQGLTNFLLAMAETPGFTEKDHILALTTICFDIAGLELFLPLILGGKVEVVSSDIIKDGIKLKEKISESKATVIQATPATWQMLLAAEWENKKPLKILCGGEALSRELADKLLERASQVWNMFGPTETTIWSTICPVRPKEKITIGRPIANTQIYILDSQLKPVPVGVPGELYIGGDGVALGYYNRPDLTKERFIPNPMDPRQGSKIYKTGDLARYLADGNIEFIGRMDQQIKIRGFRIELPEIEAALQNIQGIQEAVVVLREDIPGQKRLTAFLIEAGQNRGLAKESLDTMLKKWLPDYMVPSSYVFLKEYPMTFNRKVNRKVLANLRLEEILKQYGELQGLPIQDTDIQAQKQSKTPADHRRDDSASEDSLKHRAIQDISEIVAGIIQVEFGQIDPKTNIGDYGFDSINYTSLSTKLSKKYGIKINPNFFYMYSSIAEIVEHLWGSFHEMMVKHYPQIGENLKKDAMGKKDYMTSETTGENAKLSPQPQIGQEPVAIIGMWGSMPQSDDPDHFWKNLMDERDLVSEVPKERWKWENYFGDPVQESNKTNSKWGGFINNIDRFDAEFFGISPREALLMDPQQRLLLETVWKAIEDSGHRPSELSGTRTGVFMGITGSDFMGIMGNEIDAYTLTGIARSVLANRISYLLNLHGPSEPVDTACSSSLVAIHRAVMAIRSGECDYAIAGGVSLMLSPFAYIAASKVGMLSGEGRCKTFDSSADGYVRGEGVGALFLKPLSKAIADRDHIYGVIKGSAENHGGKANSLTAPNPKAQTALLVKAYQEADIDPATVTYIETHGTGTALGDPIEIDGLKNAFMKLNQESGHTSPPTAYCGLGSVKTNIGHLEAAAGIAGVMKVLLALKHHYLPANIHLKNKNPYIDLQRSPFYLIGNGQPWEIMKDKDGKALPRRTGVSSFGFGGANAHIIIEEYLQPIELLEKQAPPLQGPYLVILSAKNGERLSDYLEQLAKYVKIQLETPDNPDGALIENEKTNLGDMAYTLQIGRDPMEERIALITSSFFELKEKLDKVIDHSVNIPDVYRGNVKTNRGLSNATLPENPLTDLGAIHELARAWVAGTDIDWEKLYQAWGQTKEQFDSASNGISNTKTRLPHRISLPTYPFAPEVYELPEDTELVTSQVSKVSYLHPLLQRNVSTLSEEKFTTTFDGNESFLADHLVDGVKTLPGVVYLEIARLAGEIAGENKVTAISDIILAKPVTVAHQPANILIRLRPDSNAVEYEIVSEDEGNENQVHSQGRIIYHPKTSTPEETYIIEALRERLNNTKPGQDCYTLFAANRLKYGPSLQVIKEVYFNENEALSLIELPENLEDENYVFHPSIMDGALQTVILLIGTMEKGNEAMYLPFAIGKAEILQPLEEKCWVYAVCHDRSPGNQEMKRYDLSILNLAGDVLVQIKDYSIRAVPRQKMNRKVTDLVYFKEKWSNPNEGLPAAPNLRAGKVLLFDIDNEVSDLLPPKADTILVKPGTEFQRIDPRTYQMNPVMPEDYNRLYDTLAQDGIQVDTVIFLWTREQMAAAQDTVQSQLSFGLFPLFYNTKALIRQKHLEPTRIMVIDGSGGDGDDECRCAYDALNGFLRSIHMENPNLQTRMVKVLSRVNSEGDSPVKELAAIIIKELGSSSVQPEVQYENGARRVKEFVEIQPEALKMKELPLVKHGVYIITGGAGGLGRIFAEYLAQKFQANLVLTGRTLIDETKNSWLHKLESFGAKVKYLPADVSKREEVDSVIRTAKECFGPIQGVIHAAGILQDSFVIKKTEAEIKQVLAPKIQGTVFLDEATQAEPLDFFLLFSSIAAVMGNIGQCDYSFANSFMDHYAQFRNQLVKKGRRFGQSTAINWPLWQSGGMKVDPETERELWLKAGLVPLSTENGLSAFENILKLAETNVIVIEGDPEKVKHTFNTAIVAAEPTNISQAPFKPEVANDDLLTAVFAYLKEIISKATKLPLSKIKFEEPLDNYGIDSVMIISLNQELEKVFGSLSKTLFFEYQTLGELAQYFMQKHRDVLVQKFAQVKEQPVQVVHQPGTALRSVPETAMPKRPRYLSPATQNTFGKAERMGREPESKDIAIIGLSGRFPMAADLDDFWNNLAAGKDCVSEIPLERWDYHKYFDADRTKSGKTYSKWGGFLDDVDKFDPLFFNISPLEAEMLDPQERLYLQTVWHAVEDAGYTREGLSKEKVGVFTGVMWGQYQLYGAIPLEDGSVLTPASSYASISNRVSYIFNFRGPSISLDTMCSSSLTTIHLACESIRSGESVLAVAGGVNLTIHPNKHIFLSQTKFAASDGRCRSFGEGGDGYVPGEGVGAVILKPLEKAIEDGDNVYAVIKATCINHGGKTNGYTVPNPKEQMNVISDALKQSGINPRTISYIEAHGTGTSLGDPIEVTGLTKAFREYTRDNQFCAIGSVKSNIGHCESAAGIAGISKILLQLKYKRIAPSIHSRTLNPNIDFIETPFYVQQELAEWKQPVIEENGRSIVCPRRAGISSFGAGGSNAHIIIEEFLSMTTGGENGLPKPQVIVLSAKNEAGLKECAGKLAAFLLKQASQRNDYPQPFPGISGSEYSPKDHHPEKKGVSWESIDLLNIAYTLQVGREAMEERLALVVSDTAELYDKLNRYCAGEEQVESLFKGNIKSRNISMEILINGPEGEEYLNSLIQQKKLAKLAVLWVAGFEVNWEYFHSDHAPKRVSLPGYPFIKDKCWIPDVLLKRNRTINAIHPLIDEVEFQLSLAQGLVFRKKYSSRDLELYSFQCGDGRKLMESVQPEMSFGAVAKITGGDPRDYANYQLTAFNWGEPLRSNEGAELYIKAWEEAETIHTEIFSFNESESIIHSTGIFKNVPLDFEDGQEYFDIEGFMDGHEKAVPGENFYDSLAESSLVYDSSLKIIENVYLDQDEALAKIRMTELLRNEMDNFIIHPLIFDGVFQIAKYLNLVSERPGSLLKTGVVEIYGSGTDAGWITVESGVNGGTYNACVLDTQGRIWIKISEITFGNTVEDPLNRFFYLPHWIEEREPAKETAADQAEGRTLILYSQPGEKLKDYLKQTGETDNIIEIELGTKYQRYSEAKWEIATDTAQDMERVIQEIGPLKTIYFLGGMQSPGTGANELEIFEDSQEKGIIAFYRLVKALLNHGGSDTEFSLKIITNDIHKVTPLDRVQPYTASLIGFARSLAREFPMLKVVCIDVSHEDMEQDCQTLAPVKTLFGAHKNAREVAMRKGKLFRRMIEGISLPPVEKSGLKQNGVYLIVGGAGNVGFKLCCYLAETFQAKLVILGRSALNEKITSKTAQIKSLGGEAIYAQADITNPESVKNALAVAKERFGKIDGVIHSAMNFKYEPIQSLGEDQLRQDLAPKTKGSVVLLQALADEPLDFIIFFSSGESFTGNIGWGSYAAGCSFEDAYALSINQTQKQRVKIVNWGFWSGTQEEFEGMLANKGIKTIAPSQGMEAFCRVLGSPVEQVMALNVEDKVLQLMRIDLDSRIEIYHPDIPALISTLTLPTPPPAAGETAPLAMAAQVVDNYLSLRWRQTPDREIKILEIGSGKGELTAGVLELIGSNHPQIKYYYSAWESKRLDEGKQFLGGQYPFIEFIPFALKENQEEIPRFIGEMDLILVNSIDPITFLERRTIQKLKQIMKTNGVIVFLTGAALPESGNRIEEWNYFLNLNGVINNRFVEFSLNDPDGRASILILGESDGITVHQKPKTGFMEKRSDFQSRSQTKQPKPTGNESQFMPKQSSIGTDLLESTKDYITTVLSAILKIDKARIDHGVNFTNYGVDSLIVTDIHLQFEKDLGKLLATMLMENPTVEELAKYLVENRKAVLEEKLLGGRTASSPRPKNQPNLGKERVEIETKETHRQVAPGALNITPGKDLQKIAVSTLKSNEIIEVITEVPNHEIESYLEKYGDLYRNGELKKQSENGLSSYNQFKPRTENMSHLMVRTAKGSKLEVLTTGSGTPMLLVPAIGLTAPVWTRQIRQWSQDYQLIIIHHPGYGLSELGDDISPIGVANLFAEVITKLGVKQPVHVIGSCFGGVTAQFFTKECPELTASLVLCGSFYQNFGLPDISLEELPIEAMIEGAKMISAGISKDFGAIIEQAGEDLERTGDYEKCMNLLMKSQCVNPLVVMRYIAQILTLSTKELLPQIKVPTLCISGNLDTIVAPEVSKFISSQVKQGQYYEIAGAGHYPFLSHAEEFNQKVRDFLKIVEQEAALV